MAENKTRPTGTSVSAFPATVEPDRRRNDATELHDMVDGSDRRHGRDLGHSIIGYGSTRHDRSSGCGADWFPIGLSPRKTSLVLYSTTEQDPMLLAALGKHKRGVGYLYIAKLDDIDRHALRALINDTVIAPTADPHSLLSSTTQRPAQEPAMCSGVGARDDRTLHGH